MTCMIREIQTGHHVLRDMRGLLEEMKERGRLKLLIIQRWVLASFRSQLMIMNISDIHNDLQLHYIAVILKIILIQVLHVYLFRLSQHLVKQS